MKISIIFIIIYLMLNIYNINSQNYWSRTFGGYNDELAWSLLQTKDGNILVIGEKKVQSKTTGVLISQTYLIKYNPKGNIIWEKIYGDSILNNYSYMAAEDSTGDIYIASNWLKPTLLKINDEGRVIFQKEYELPISSFGGIQLTQNTIIINGTSYYGNVFSKSLTKLDKRGNLIWNKVFADSGNIEGNYNGFLITEQNYYVCGVKRFNNNIDNGVVIKTDTSGNIIWQKLTEDYKIFNTICSISNYSFYALGISYGINTGGYLLKFNINGDFLFEKYLKEDSIGYSNSIIKANQNKYAFVYFRNGSNGIAIIDSNYQILQNKIHFYQPIDAVIYRFINNYSDNGYILSGYIEHNNTNNIDGLVVKTDLNGETTPIGIININHQIDDSNLHVNIYPNPFNPNTMINFKINQNEYLEIKMYDILGNELLNIAQKEFFTGVNTIPLNLQNLNFSTGPYFIVIKNLNTKKLKTFRVIYIK